MRSHAHDVQSIALRREMLARFETVGARVVEVDVPEDWDTLTSRSFNNVRLPERSEPFLGYLREDVRLFGVSLSPWINGLLLSGTEYVRGQRAKLLLLERVLDGIFDQGVGAHQQRQLSGQEFAVNLLALGGVGRDARPGPPPRCGPFRHSSLRSQQEATHAYRSDQPVQSPCNSAHTGYQDRQPV